LVFIAGFLRDGPLTLLRDKDNWQLDVLRMRHNACSDNVLQFCENPRAGLCNNTGQMSDQPPGGYNLLEVGSGRGRAAMLRHAG
jgi:hypothetical protein